MSRIPNLDLSPPDSQVAGSLDYLSFPSEPPDIRNWFSSYKYNSPVLDTVDCFQDSGGAAEISHEQDDKGKFDGLRVVGKLGDECVSEEKGFTDGFEQRKPTLVSGLSESLSQCSEPPDIKNWFSSYVYESPPLDIVDSFTSEYKEKKSNVSNALKSCNTKEISDIAKVSILPSPSKISAVALKCANLVGYDKQDDQSVSKDGYNIDLKQRTSEQMFHEGTTENQKHGSVETFGCSLQDTSLKNNSFCRNENYISESTKDSPEKENLIVLGGSSPRRRNVGKENEINNITEDGFVSTRKKSTELSDPNQRTQLGKKVQFKKNGMAFEKDGKMSRKPLSETTNIHSPNVLGITGKWHCPQKHKPYVGPPLKQLRLEQWVRRV